MRVIRARWLAAVCLASACSGDLDPFGDPRGINGDGAGGALGDGGTKGSDDDCDPHSVAANSATPDMLIVLDRSASMAPDGNAQMTDRWAGSVAAVTEVAKEFDKRVHFGLMTYPGPQAMGNGRGGNSGNVCATGALSVNIAAGSGAAIGSALSMTQPGGYTPTAATLQEAAKIIGSIGIADQTVIPPKFVLLVTDGDPNCASGPGSPTSNDPVARQQTIDAITALAQTGVRTFVVGFQTGASAFAGTLDQMAVAGATGEQKHRSVESGKDLAKAIEDIAGKAISCSYRLALPVNDPAIVHVTVAKKERAHANAADGWMLGPDMRTITLTGAACDAVRKGSTLTVQVDCTQFVQ